MRIELRRPAGNIQRRDPPACHDGDHGVHGFAGHFLGTLRTRPHVAVHAGLVAAVTHIDLQGIEPVARKRRKCDRFKDGPSVSHERHVSRPHINCPDDDVGYLVVWC